MQHYPFHTIETKVANITTSDDPAIVATLEVLEINSNNLITLDETVTYRELFQKHGEGIYLTFGTEPMFDGNPELHAEAIKFEHGKVMFSGWTQENIKDPATKKLMKYKEKSSDNFIQSSNSHHYKISKYYFKPFIQNKHSNLIDIEESKE